MSFPTRYYPSWTCFCSVLLTVLPLGSTASAKLSFNRDVRPIFSDTCFACHGPDESNNKGGLRLDSLARALQGGKSKEPALVAGKPLESNIYKRLINTDETEIMPPPEFHKVLKPKQIETIKQWIAEGAEYEGHWAFVKPTHVTVPPVPNGGGGGNEIDSFLRPALAAKGLKANPEADKATLIRRASLDLIGLPPTENEIDAFEKDTSPDAWSKLIDRLMASPHYGERMAMPWLDNARYADSHGFQTDSSRTMWPWRDWVINAFNANMPFDQFTVEQLAGDLLPNPTLSNKVATGFNRNHRINGEGGLIAAEWRMENIIDRVETTGSTWLALTLNCCRCHDHKYDPITQKEFYQLTAYFNSVTETGILGQKGQNRAGGNPEPVLELLSEEHQAKVAKLDEAVANAAKAVKATTVAPDDFAKWEQSLRVSTTASGLRTTPLDVTSAAAATANLKVQADRSWLATGKTTAKEVYTIKAKLTDGPLTGLVLEALPDPSLKKGPGRAANGNFVLSGIKAEITAPSLPEPIKIDFVGAETDFEQPNYNIKGLVIEPTATRKKAKPALTAGWAVNGYDPKLHPRLRALFTFKEISVPKDASMSIELKQESFPNHSIGRFSLSTIKVPSALASLKGTTLSAESVKALATAPNARSSEQKEILLKLYTASEGHPNKKFESALDAAQKARTAYGNMIPTVMVMKELDKPADAFLLKRGQYDQPDGKVERMLPAVFPKLPDGQPNNRLGLAKWLVNGEHPLTARVWVNRTWERLFGTGIVKTTEDFGSQAEWPSHPELLDWLAIEFVKRGWDMKAMHKLMMMSAAYRQSANVTPELLEKDPENRYYARGPRFRLQAELLRDQALALSGLLVPKVGGASVRPYMPENVWDETSVYGDMRGYKSDTGEGLYRRTLYTIWKRTSAPPSMLLFDSPSREICVVKRSRTNTPLQALALLNEITYVEAASKLAARIMKEGGATAEARIAWGFRHVTARHATPDEISVLKSGLDKRLARFQTEPASAQKLIDNGDTSPDPSLPPIELAAWTVTANILLNLDEIVTR
jgi:cytochrome c553